MFLARFHALLRAHRCCLSVSSWDLSSNFIGWGLRWWGFLSCVFPRDGPLLSRVLAFASDLASCACPALLGRESTARTCGCRSRRGRSRDWSRSDRAGAARIRETWEGRRRDGEIKDTCAMNLFMTLEPRVYVTRMKMCEVRSECAVRRKVCVRHVSVCTHPVVHTVITKLLTTSVGKNSVERINEHLSLHDHLDKKQILQFVVWVRWVYVQNPFKKFSDFIVPCPCWSFLLVLVPSVGFSSIIVSGGFSVSRGMRLWETDLPDLLIFDDAFVWSFSNCVRSIQAICASSGSSRHIICGFGSASSIHANNAPLWSTTAFSCCVSTTLSHAWKYRRWYSVVHRSGGFGNALSELMNSFEAIKNRHICTSSWWPL